MKRIIVLDSGPLGMVFNPKASPENDAVKDWLFAHFEMSDILILPEIADYEVRRELIRSGKTSGIASLDFFKSTREYLPLDTETMLEAAQLWAEARNRGKPATNSLALDGDMILVAQARAAARVLAEASANGHTVVATINPKHLTYFCDARWGRDINNATR